MTNVDGDLNRETDHYEQQAAQLGRTSIDDVAKYPQSQKLIATPAQGNRNEDDEESGLLGNPKARRTKTEKKIEEERGEEDEDDDEEEKKE